MVADDRMLSITVHDVLLVRWRYEAKPMQGGAGDMHAETM